MVDPEHLRLLKGRVHPIAQRLGAALVMPVRLLDNDPGNDPSGGRFSPAPASPSITGSNASGGLAR
jgi:hypothetical protein